MEILTKRQSSISNLKDIFRMKKILLLIDSLGSGGAQRQAVNIAISLKKREYTVEILCYFQKNFFESLLNSNNIRVIWIVENNPIMRILKIRNFIRNQNYGSVISFCETPDFLNFMSSIGRHSWKVITSERSAKEYHLTSIKGKFFAYFKRYSDYIVCNSENAKQLWLKYYPFYEHKLKVIYNIVDIGETDLKYDTSRNKKINIVVAASYQALKNPINLIRSLDLLTEEERRKIRIDWYGEKVVSENEGSKIYDESLHLIKKNNLISCICLHESTKDIYEKMSKSDYVALFSSVEGLPNSICEAMTLGKPILMTPVSDYKIFIKDNGFIVPNTSPDAISTSIRLLFNIFEDQLLCMGSESRRRAISLFSENVNIEKWISLIK